MALFAGCNPAVVLPELACRRYVSTFILLVLPLTCRLPRLPRMCLPADSQLGLLEGLIASGEQLGLAIEQVDILKANVEASRLFLLFSEAVCMAACVADGRSPIS